MAQGKRRDLEKQAKRLIWEGGGGGSKDREGGTEGEKEGGRRRKGEAGRRIEVGKGREGVSWRHPVFVDKNQICQSLLEQKKKSLEAFKK